MRTSLSGACVLLLACGGATGDAGSPFEDASPGTALDGGHGEPAGDAGPASNGGETSSDGGVANVGPGADAEAADAGTDASPTPAGYEPIVEFDPPADVFAVSDPHGELAALEGILQAGKLADAKGAWAGGNATLVVVGDLIDKGSQSLEVIDLLRKLTGEAPPKGGRVIVTLGNHEAEFIADPQNSKATGTGVDKVGIDVELMSQNIPPASVAGGTDAKGRGAFLRSLPFAARVGKSFFAHAGDTQGVSLSALRTDLAAAHAAGYGDPRIIGAGSILESKGWATGMLGASYTAALGVDRIVFGHEPKALGSTGIATTKNRTLVKIDTAMGLGASTGSANPALLLRITRAGALSVLDDRGRETPL